MIHVLKVFQYLYTSYIAYQDHSRLEPQIFDLKQQVLLTLFDKRRRKERIIEKVENIKAFAWTKKIGKKRKKRKEGAAHFYLS